MVIGVHYAVAPPPALPLSSRVLASEWALRVLGVYGKVK